MIFSIFELSIFFFFLSILLLINVVWSNIWWQAKAILIVVSLAFFVTSYQSIDNLLGRPTQQALPDEYKFIASLIHEPSRKTGEPGAIYLLTIDEIDYKMYKLPYSKNMKKMVRDAQKARGKGAKVVVKRRKGKISSIPSVAGKTGKRPATFYKDLDGVEWNIVLTEPVANTK